MPHTTNVTTPPTKLYHASNTWNIIAHMPLCEEGMMLYVWPNNNSCVSTGQYIHLPFGSILALPAHTVHSGMYGSNGSVLLQMLIRERQSSWVVDKLIEDIYKCNSVIVTYLSHFYLRICHSMT
jgi:hypothetical protein